MALPTSFKENPRKYALIFRFSALLCVLISSIFLLFLPYIHFGYGDSASLKERGFSEQDIQRLDYDVSPFHLLIDSLSQTDKDYSDQTLLNLYTQSDWNETAPIVKAFCIMKNSYNLFQAKEQEAKGFSFSTKATLMTKYKFDIDDENAMNIMLLFTPAIQIVFGVVTLLTGLIITLKNLPMLRRKATFKPGKKVGVASFLSLFFTVFILIGYLIAHAASNALIGVRIGGLIALPLILSCGAVVLDAFRYIIGKNVKSDPAPEQQTA